MLPAFEEGLNGLVVGDTFRFTLTPENAYGEFNEEHVVELPKNMFEIDGKFDNEFVKEGNTIPMMDDRGQRMNGSVLEVKGDVVVMDFKHPLAGETLHFNGTVLDVREPTADDMAAMNAAMNPGCGGGCAGCESDCNIN
jgi:FKBP-type peptidyl-prolyl cis-trans isomerase SlyD